MDKKELSNNIIISCQWCNCDNTLEDWNKNTYAQCINREMKRLYTSLRLPKAFKRESDTYYKCPNCGKWLRGSQLVVKSDDEKLKRLGGESIFQIVSDK